ncbi:hypothetical protein K466DRAFT_541962 [Polyporus arcularius HHB13444]|uniref:Uncharacterized protein n=1 Tax=Polyporus arcularius HHB13444 TaxID=1314778 RepID=A0A5C3PNP6_9APHY|nr:hypothetical protein K466DRAFT_541962 [Polyporus arcularius HHB13444]
MSSNPSTNGNQSRGASVGGGLGTAVRGAFETVQGIGNNIRGNAMDFVDSATGTGPRHSTEAEVGRKQTEEGVQRMEAGSHGVANTSSTAATTGSTGHAPPPPTTTATAAPPLPPRNAQGSL